MKLNKLGPIPKGAIEELVAILEDFEETRQRQDNTLSTLECRLEESEVYNEKLLNDIAELKDYISDLETSLAEACLMSQDDGPQNEATEAT